MLPSSVGSLVQTLSADGEDKYSHTARHHPDSDLLFAKGNYSYAYIDRRDKLLMTELLLIDAISCSLTEETIAPEKWERAQKVWREFGIENMQQYQDLYLNLDVLLLADVFENFRPTFILDYGIDSAHYYTLLGFILNACLNFMEQKLDLFTDSEQFLFIENAIRGGISVVSHRHAKVNNPLVSTTIPTPPLIFDLRRCNNLYGEAMSDALSIGISHFIQRTRLNRST